MAKAKLIQNLEYRGARKWAISIDGKIRPKAAIGSWSMVYTVATAGTAGRDIQEQTKLVLEAIDQNLADIGTDKTRIVSAQIFMEDMDQKLAMDEVWCDWAGGRLAKLTATRLCWC